VDIAVVYMFHTIAIMPCREEEEKRRNKFKTELSLKFNRLMRRANDGDISIPCRER